MIRPDQIPDEVVEAAARQLYETHCAKYYAQLEWLSWESIDAEYRDDHRSEARAAIAAALSAWPGAFPWKFTGPLEGAGYVLPLPPDDETTP